MRIALTVNGRPEVVEVSPRTNLADFVREHLLLTGTHVGCEHGVCGACTVVINGETARSCITYAASCDGAEVRTIEGYGCDPLMARLRLAFKQEHALQCGYCTPGMLIAARDLIRRKGGLSESEIRVAMSGNLCRCTGYVGIIRAIEAVMAERDGLLGGVEPAVSYLGPSPGLTGAGANIVPPRTASAAGVASAPPAPSSAADLAPWDDRNATRLEEQIRIPAPRVAVWALMSDVERVAACVPGARLDGPPMGEQITGVIAVKLGPIATSFRGVGRIATNDAGWRGSVEGQGQDGSSRARGRITYRLLDDGPQATRVDMEIAYALTGPLAQFSRGDLVRNIVRSIARAFAANVAAEIAHGAGDGRPGGGLRPQAAPLNAGRLMWLLVTSRLRAIVARLTGRSPER